MKNKLLILALLLAFAGPVFSQGRDPAAEFTRTKSNGAPREGKLVLCPSAPGELDRVALSAEENVSFDAASLTVATIA